MACIVLDCDIYNFKTYFFLHCALIELIDIGWDAPAGQMYSSTHDLAQLMKLIFRPEDAYNPGKGQVWHTSYILH